MLPVSATGASTFITECSHILTATPVMTTTIDVLHIDDDPAFTELVATYLHRKESQISVTSATSATEALSKLDSNTFDCIVSDYDMPEMDGLALLETVRSQGTDLPYILFTGKGSEEIASDAITAGVTDYLQKGGPETYTVLANRITNVVAQYRASQTAEQTEKRLREIAEQTTDLLWMVSADWTEVLFINSVYQELTGATVSDVIENPLTFFATVHPEDRARISAQLRSVSEGDVVDVECRINEKEGYTRWVWAQAEPIMDDTGEVDRIVGFAREITEKKEQERKLEQLRDTSQKLMHTQSIEETAEVAVTAAHEIIGAPLSGVHLLNDAGDQIVPCFVFDSVRDAFGTVPVFNREHAQQSRAAVIWDVFENGTPCRIDNVSAYDGITETTPTESVIVHPIGSYGVFIVSANTTDAFDDRDEALVEILARSLTAAMDRVTREQRIRHREQRLKELHDATRQLIQAESKTEIAEEIVSSAAEILGFSIMVVRFYNPETEQLEPAVCSDPVANLLPDRDGFGADGDSLNWDAYASGAVRTYADIETTSALDTGTGLRSLAIFPLGGYGTVSVGETTPGAFDETDIFLGQILITAAETAIDSIERTAVVEQQRNELKVQNRRLNDFTSIVTHDLRNPLNVAQGWLAQLESEYDNNDTRIDRIKQAHSRIDTLIDSLLMVAQTGEQALEHETRSLRELATQCWKTVEQQDAALEIHSDCTLYGDTNQLSQLFENLFRNAIEHNDGVVTITVGQTNDQAGFYVEDSGRGIPVSDQNDVFIFGYSSAADGTGLGLAIVLRIVEAHGWMISISESESGGARFEIRFDSAADVSTV